MKNLLVILAFIGLTFGGLAQEGSQSFAAPDYKAIEKAVADPNGDCHYPTLLQRFNSGDTSLTEVQLQHLYYGTIYQESYHPYRSGDWYDEYRAAKDSAEEYPEALKRALSAAEKGVREAPVSLRARRCYAYCCYDLYGRDDVRTRIAVVQFYQLIDIILHSGRGLSSEEAWHVISVSDEYVVLSELGLQPQGQSLVGNCDRFQVSSEEYDVEEVYFNTLPSLIYLEKMYNDKK